jgi:hypothetical protein
LTERKSGIGRCNGLVIASLNRKFGGPLPRGHLARRFRSDGSLKQLLSKSVTYDRRKAGFWCGSLWSNPKALTCSCDLCCNAQYSSSGGKKLAGTLPNRIPATAMNWRQTKGECFRRLWSVELSAFRDHLMRLDQESRYARFSMAVSDYF